MRGSIITVSVVQLLDLIPTTLVNAAWKAVDPGKRNPWSYIWLTATLLNHWDIVLIALLINRPFLKIVLLKASPNGQNVQVQMKKNMFYSFEPVSIIISLKPERGSNVHQLQFGYNTQFAIHHSSVVRTILIKCTSDYILLYMSKFTKQSQLQIS